MTTIEEHIFAYQNGNKELFESIYELLLPTKRQAISRLRKLLPSCVSDDDISAMYDDEVFLCLEKYDPDLEASFKTFLFKALETSRKMHIRYLNAEKRHGDYLAESLDCPINSNTEKTIVDLIVDDSSVNPIDNLTCIDIINSLNTFRNTSKVNRTYADLIACSAMPYNSEEEKITAVSKVLGEKIEKSAMHKRIKRARNAFKIFLQNN